MCAGGNQEQIVSKPGHPTPMKKLHKHLHDDEHDLKTNNHETVDGHLHGVFTTFNSNKEKIQFRQELREKRQKLLDERKELAEDIAAVERLEDIKQELAELKDMMQLAKNKRSAGGPLVVSNNRMKDRPQKRQKKNKRLRANKGRKKRGNLLGGD